MKNKLALVLIIIANFNNSIVFGQSYSLTVINGYGAGSFQAGDTVTVYCKELLNNETFANWTLSVPVQTVTDKREWWFRFVMPNSNLTITANLNPSLPANFLAFEQIRGRDTLKKVYYNLNYNNEGIVFLFHGGGGQASNLIGNENYDKYYLVKQLVQNNYGVIISECEERSINFDTDGSGNFTWQPRPYDSILNPDYANYITITDTFRNRGLINPQTPWFGWGGSNGGSFSGNFSYFFNCKAAAIYIASSQSSLVSVSNVPFYFAVMPNDEMIGSSGNSQALDNHNILLSRGICTEYYMNEQMPLYPEYFMRSSGITLSESIAIYNDLVSNQCLNNKKYLIVSPSTIQAMVMDNPSKWKSLTALSNAKRNQVLSLLSVAYGGHEIFSNHCARTIDFFDNLCTATSLSDISNIEGLHVYPNPSQSLLFIKTDNNHALRYQITNSIGQIILQDKLIGNNIDISGLPTGIYFIQWKDEKGQLFTSKFIKE